MQNKKTDPAIKKIYEEMVEKDLKYGEGSNYTDIEEECK